MRLSARGCRRYWVSTCWCTPDKCWKLLSFKRSAPLSSQNGNLRFGCVMKPSPLRTTSRRRAPRRRIGPQCTLHDNLAVSQPAGVQGGRPVRRLCLPLPPAGPPFRPGTQRFDRPARPCRLGSRPRRRGTAHRARQVHTDGGSTPYAKALCITQFLTWPDQLSPLRTVPNGESVQLPNRPPQTNLNGACFAPLSSSDVSKRLFSADAELCYWRLLLQVSGRS